MKSVDTFHAYFRFKSHIYEHERVWKFFWKVWINCGKQGRQIGQFDLPVFESLPGAHITFSLCHWKANHLQLFSLHFRWSKWRPTTKNYASEPTKLQSGSRKLA